MYVHDTRCNIVKRDQERTSTAQYGKRIINAMTEEHGNDKSTKIKHDRDSLCQRAVLLYHPLIYMSN